MRLGRGFAKGVAGTASLPIFSVFFRFLPFLSVFPLSSFRFLPFFLRFLRFLFSISFSEKNGETPFARPLLRNPDQESLQERLSSGSSNATSCGLRQNRVTVIRAPGVYLEGGSTVLQEPCLDSTLGFAYSNKHA